MRHRLLYSALAVLVASLAGGPAWATSASVAVPSKGQLQQAVSYCLHAESALKAGNVKRARESLNRALEIIPDFSPAHMGLGHLALSERRYEEALREYRLARDQYAELARTLIEIRSRDFGNSRAEITALEDELTKERKYNAPPLRITRIEAAIDRLERMPPPHQVMSDQPPAYIDFYIGNALFHLNRLPEAVDSWQSCLAKDREFAPAYQNLVVGYWLMGKKEDARQIAAKAKELGIELDPGLKADLERGVDFGAQIPRPN